MNVTGIEGIKQEDKQKIFECLSQAIGEDRYEADNVLGLKTHVSAPFLNWDLIYRNLINAFSDDGILYSTCKRGMWEVLLLYDANSGLILSFMRDTRFQEIKRRKVENQPQYVRALITLNSELQAEEKQQLLYESEVSEDRERLVCILNDLCAGFEAPVNTGTSHHALIVFSNQYGRLNSLKAYILDRDLDIVCEQDWLDESKPIMSNVIETISSEKSQSAPSLKAKALERLHKKELVALKEKESEQQA